MGEGGSVIDVLVVDDHEIVRRGVERMLEGIHFRIVAGVSCGETALRIAIQRRPTAALVDLTLIGSEWTGEETMLRLRRAVPRMRIVAFTGRPLDAQSRARLFDLADAVLQKDVRRDQLVTALTPTEREHALPRPNLTPRQGEVLALILEGWTNADIAAELGVSINTVKRHVSAVLERSEARSRSELISQSLR